jgi:hypothetical protein
MLTRTYAIIGEVELLDARAVTNDEVTAALEANMPCVCQLQAVPAAYVPHIIHFGQPWRVRDSFPRATLPADEPFYNCAADFHKVDPVADAANVQDAADAEAVFLSAPDRAALTTGVLFESLSGRVKYAAGMCGAVRADANAAQFPAPFMPANNNHLMFAPQ